MGGENEVIALHGAPRLKEHAIVHKPSRTLIVAHLVFNFRADERGWNRFFHRDIAGFKRYLGMSRIFRLCISDRSAFALRWKRFGGRLRPDHCRSWRSH
jgi:hypothetical protein